MPTNTYNHYDPPYRQSSAHQYASYQTAPASSNAMHPPHQFRQPPTTQSQDYMPYPAQSYTHQGSGYGTAQDVAWNNGSYSGARETTNQAAKVLHHMSNPSYTTHSTSASNQPGFTSNSAASSGPSRYDTDSSLPQRNYPVYGQSQAPAHSVNIDRAKLGAHALPSPTTAPPSLSQATKSAYSQQQQRTVSPAQPQYNTVPASNGHSAIPTTGNQQYGDHSSQRLPSVETIQSSQNATRPSTYAYGTEPMRSAEITPPTTNGSIADTYYTQGTTTVDPMAIYDPWPEYQRKQAAQKAMEDAARAEKDKIEIEERKQQEEMDRLAQSQPRPTVEQGQEQQRLSVAEAASASPASDGDSGDALETEIRAMMAKMRELNSKDPALLARIWEEERKAKAPKPTIQTEFTPQPSITQSTQPAHASSLQPANMGGSTAPREARNANLSKPASPVSIRQVETPTPASRPTGSTIWPPKKKADLAKAAAAYLNSQDTLHKITPTRILSMLNCNPSYIQLCEQLEHMKFKLDRAAFAKSLLTAVPDVNSRSHQPSPPPAPTPVHRPPVPPAVMKKEVSNSVALSPQYTPISGSSTNAAPYSPYPVNASPAGPPAPAPVAEMVPIRAELRKPANKEEAARKRNLSDLVDLTQLSDEDAGPSFKRLDTGSKDKVKPQTLNSQGMRDGDEQLPTPNFPLGKGPSQSPQSFMPWPQVPKELAHTPYVQPIERNKALRRNNYNPATIARDVLLACGRHPSQRSLNQHLDPLRANLPHITFDSDLSTIRWDLIDPGNPPPDYFKDRVEELTQDADAEDDSADEERYPRPPSNVIGGQGAAQAKAQALPEAINPFVKKKRRGRPPRSSLANNAEPPERPAPMSPSVQTASGAGGVGYAAFRTTPQYGPDGTPIAKKRGRPVGWRKAIHGSAATQAPRDSNKDTGAPKEYRPQQPSFSSNVHTADSAIRIDSRSPSVTHRVSLSYKCKWQHCRADLHNLDTLRKHVFKMHRKEVRGNILDCLWDDCGKEVHPPSFDLESNWRSHLQHTHFDPLLWELGDGPASGLSDFHDSDAYLSDAQGRQVTPRITVDPERLQALSASPPELLSRGRGRPPKRTLEQEARDAHDRLVSLKNRIGGPGMDRGGATLVNDKRRRGLIDETDEEIVDVED